jgi:hypothetical protein
MLRLSLLVDAGNCPIARRAVWQFTVMCDYAV